MASIKDKVENGQLLAFSTRKKHASNLFLLYTHSTSTGGSIKNISGLQSVIIYCPPPFQRGMRASSVKRKAEEWRKHRSNTTAGATSPVAQTVRKYLKISTDITRKRKRRDSVYLVCSLALSVLGASLAICPTLLLAAGACPCFVLPCLVCAVLVPAPCLSSQSIAKTT